MNKDLRWMKHKKPVVATFETPTDVHVFEFISMAEAAKKCKVNKKTVFNHCTNQVKKTHGLTFRWK